MGKGFVAVNYQRSALQQSNIVATGYERYAAFSQGNYCMCNCNMACEYLSLEFTVVIVKAFQIAG